MAINEEWKARGIKLKKARESKGWFQKDVGKIINKSVSAISDYEAGRKRIEFDDLKTLCIIFDIEIKNF